VLDRGVTGQANRRYFSHASGGYITGEKLRSDSAEATLALSRQKRYHPVAGNLRVTHVRVDHDAVRDRFVVCHNPERARREAALRAQIVARASTRSTAGTRWIPPSAPSSPGGSRPSPPITGCCAPPPRASCASIAPP
jgi:hypothetical protein